MKSRLQDLPVGDRYRRAEMHFSRGMLSLACEEFEALLSSSAELPVEIAAEVRWRMATCLVGSGRMDDAEECVALGRFRLRSHLVDLGASGKGAHVGYTGQVRFRFLTGDAYWARVMRTLAAYAFWAGAGYRTTAGLGQTQRVEEE